jgi:hypothetical protein
LPKRYTKLERAEIDREKALKKLLDAHSDYLKKAATWLEILKENNGNPILSKHD